MTQDDFDKLIKTYNEDFYNLLVRAGERNYAGLLPAFMRLKNLYYAIVECQAANKYLFRILPYPLSFRASDDLLRAMGFNDKRIGNIYGFLEFVKETEGKEFEEYLKRSA